MNLKVSDLSKSRVRGKNPRSPRIRLQQVQTVVEEGTATVEVRGDARVTVHSGATVRTEWRLLNETLGVDATFRSRTPGIARMSGDTLRWVSDGEAEVVVKTKDEELLLKATVSQVDPTDVVTFHSWVEGSLAHSASSAIDTLLAGKTPDADTLRLFDSYNHGTQTYVRNTSGWFSSLNSKLTAVSVWHSRYGEAFRGTLITERHYMTAAHAPHAAGDTVRWVSATNEVCNRNVIATYVVPGTDAQICLLEASVIAGITPARTTPQDVRDYLTSTQYGVPVIVPHFEGDVRVTNLVQWDDTSWGYQGTVFNPPFPSEGNRRDFWRGINTGGSGGPALMIVDGELMLVTTWTTRTLGPKYFEIDWAAVIAEVDSIAEVERTNRFTYSHDPTERWPDWQYYSDGTKPFHTPNAIEGPFPGTMADKLAFTAVAWPIDSTLRHQAIVLTPGVYTYSVYLKAGTFTPFPICARADAARHTKLCAVTTEWQRFSITFTVSAATDNVYFDFGWDRFAGESGPGGEVYIYGVQVDEGYAATAYVPTEGAGVTAEGSGLSVRAAGLPKFTWFGVQDWFLRFEHDYGTFLDAAMTTPTPSGGRVRAWKDRSGNERNLVAPNLDWGPQKLLDQGLYTNSPANLLWRTPNPFAGLPKATYYCLYRSNVTRGSPWATGAPLVAGSFEYTSHHLYLGEMYEGFGSSDRPHVGTAPEIGDWSILRVTSEPGRFRVWVNDVLKLDSGTNTVAWNATAAYFFAFAGNAYDGCTKALMVREETPTTEENAKIMAWLSAKKVDPLKPYTFTLLLLPDRGVFTDAAMEVPAENDGDLVYHWVDVRTGKAYSQANSSLRPILRIGANGRRWLDFPDGRWLGGDIAFSGYQGWIVSSQLKAACDNYGRALSLYTDSNTDYGGGPGVAAVLRDAATNAINSYYNGPRTSQAVSLDTWNVYTAIANGSGFSTWLNGVSNLSSSVTTSLAPQRMYIGQGTSGEKWNGPIQAIAIANMSDVQMLEVGDILRAQFPT